MMMMVLYRDCYRDVETTTSPVLPESPRTGAAAAAGTEVPASGAAGGWMLSRRREEAAASPHTGRGLHCTLGALQQPGDPEIQIFCSVHRHRPRRSDQCS